ncbi:GDSL-type esterase/lipase family protein [Paenibacillus sp. CC-CFT747]|nr:GDSL-type esterase/lipase family protein [Paenibacillus sp. CC-CFT747]
MFLGWGQSEIHEGQVSVELYAAGSQSRKLPELSGRFEDMTPRDYYVEILDVSSEDHTFSVRMAMSGEDYGTGVQLEGTSMRWSEPVLAGLEDPIPLKVPSAYGKGVDWGLAISFASLGDLPDRGACYKISAKPHMLMDRRTSPRDPLHFVERERFGHLEPVMERMRNGQPVRIAFYGESTTRSGRWPYEVANALRTRFPACTLYTSNVAVSGESSMRGIARLQDEVLNLKPDLVIIEYFINDGYSGEAEASERSLRAIIEDCRRAGACCLLLTNNGRNPIFSESGSRRETCRVHEQMKRIAQETQIAFVGGYSYFFQLHLYGRYFLTELKGNMLNHPYGNVDPGWGSFDRVLADAILKGMDSC